MGKGKFDYKVGYAEASLKKKESYVKIPKTMVRETGVTKAEQGSWFGYQSKYYYPLTLVDTKTDKVVTPAKTIMKLTIQSDVDGMHPAELACKPDKAGVYWFKGIRAFIFGKMSVTFSVDVPDKSVEPYSHTVDVEFDEEGRTLEDLPVEEEAVEEEEEPVKKSGGRKKSDPSSEKKRKYEKVGSSPDKTSTGRQKKKSRSQSLNMDIVQPIPNSSLLSGKHHLRPAGIVDLIEQCGATGKRDEVTINGPQLFISLTPSLMHALIKDRLRVGQLAARIEKTPTDATRLLEEEENLHRPTANELFLKLYNKTAHIPEAENVLRQLRYLFEYAFESKVLYTEEKKIYKHLISNIRRDDSKFGDNFGVAYYLRFLLYVTAEADFLMPIDCEQGASASSQRTKAVSDRHSKGLFSTAQQLLDNAIRDLEDSAIALFA